MNNDTLASTSKIRLLYSYRQVLRAVSLEQMTLKLVLSEALLANRAEVICLICLTHEQVGIGLEITRSRARGGDS